MPSKKIGILLTLDYEICGNGEGDFEELVYLPTNEILRVCDAYGAKLTCMAEMGHYWGMQKYPNLFKKEIDLFESQLKKIIATGHDVQMHFHPQWIGAQYKENKWVLNFKNLSFASLDYATAFKYAQKGKRDLEVLLKPVKSDYQCIGFRSGFWCMQPSSNPIKALVDAGYISDTSVMKGLHVETTLRNINYSSAYSNYAPWQTGGNEICQKMNGGPLLEFPVLSDYSYLPNKNFTAVSIQSIKGKLKKCSPIPQPPLIKRGVWTERLRKLFKKKWYEADFCSVEYKNLIRMVNKVFKDVQTKKGVSFVPLVLIGHTKDFFFSNNLANFLSYCKKNNHLEFYTYCEAIREHQIP